MAGRSFRHHRIRGYSVTQDRGPIIRQRASHAQLIGHSDPNPANAGECVALDAIVVPASRPAYNLEHAITLARAVGCRLVILCSRDSHPAAVRDLLAMRSFADATVIEVPPRYRHEFFEFETTKWARERFPARNSDLSMKRNVGLVLGRMLGWQRIFFLDDDIRDLDAASLLATVAVVGGESPEQRYYSAGMTTVDFPDNSVVCHARRAIGEFQGVFVSGSALAVDCTGSFSFFPDIYNEDWLFFYRDVTEGRLGSSGRTATQLRYDPFANPQRAANEEFGDVIAEGLYALRDQGLSPEYATTDEYWRLFLADRMRILDEIIESGEAPLRIRWNMRLAVAAARKCLEAIQPGTCVEYIECWRRDLGLWERTLKRIRPSASISDALFELGLGDYHEYFVGLYVGFGHYDLRSPHHRLLSM
jgi:hypothetical protein